MVTKSEDIFGLEYTNSKNSLKIEALSKSEYAVLSFKCMTSGGSQILLHARCICYYYCRRVSDFITCSMYLLLLLQAKFSTSHVRIWQQSLSSGIFYLFKIFSCL